MIISLVVDRFENGKTVLKTDDNQTIIWPKNKLPENLREGAALDFEISENGFEEKKKKNLAKDLLNEILDTGKENQ